jgi:glucokinase
LIAKNGEEGIPMTEENRAISIGIDIGGTSTRIGVFPTLATPGFTLVTRFPTQSDYAHQMRAIIAALQESGIKNPAGIGVSIGARIAKDGRSVIFGPNMLDYIHKPFASDLEQAFACPIRLAHDTVCGLLGEKKFGRIHDDERCAYLTLSTGTGAAFQLGKMGTALTISIEFGHQILDGNTLVCLCGQVGCLETFTGGRQLELRLGRSVAQMIDQSFWETFSDKLALGLVNFVQIAKVETIAVSGAIALNNPFLLPMLQLKVDELLKGARVELVRAALGENAPIVGAALLLETPETSILH